MEPATASALPQAASASDALEAEVHVADAAGATAPSAAEGTAGAAGDSPVLVAAGAAAGAPPAAVPPTGRGQGAPSAANTAALARRGTETVAGGEQPPRRAKPAAAASKRGQQLPLPVLLFQAAPSAAGSGAAGSGAADRTTVAVGVGTGSDGSSGSAQQRLVPVTSMPAHAAMHPAALQLLRAVAAGKPVDSAMLRQLKVRLRVVCRAKQSLSTCMLALTLAYFLRQDDSPALNRPPSTNPCQPPSILLLLTSSRCPSNPIAPQALPPPSVTERRFVGELLARQVLLNQPGSSTAGQAAGCAAAGAAATAAAATGSATVRAAAAGDGNGAATTANGSVAAGAVATRAGDGAAIIAAGSTPARQAASSAVAGATATGVSVSVASASASGTAADAPTATPAQLAGDPANAAGSAGAAVSQQIKAIPGQCPPEPLLNAAPGLEEAHRERAAALLRALEAALRPKAR